MQNCQLEFTTRKTNNNTKTVCERELFIYCIVLSSWFAALLGAWNHIREDCLDSDRGSSLLIYLVILSRIGLHLKCLILYPAMEVTNNLSLRDFNHICRFCLETASDHNPQLPLFQPYSKSNDDILPEIIDACIGIKVGRWKCVLYIEAYCWFVTRKRSIHKMDFRQMCAPHAKQLLSSQATFVPNANNLLKHLWQSKNGSRRIKIHPKK